MKKNSKQSKVAHTNQTQFDKLPSLLIPWFYKNARSMPWRADKDPYHVWLSEIMLQQTRVDTVIDYYLKFLHTFPTVADLAEADEEKVLKRWEGLGYYTRARNLHKAAKIIHNDYQDVFPNDLDSLMALPGIGPYSAGAIASICFGLPTPAVDGNVLRVVTRITDDHRSIDEPATKKDIAANLAAVYPQQQCGDFTQSLMELGAIICLPNGAPLCPVCPASIICQAFKNDTIPILPVKKEKPARSIKDITVFVLFCDDSIAVRKRIENGVLKGLWEFPNWSGFLDEAALTSILKKNNLGDCTHIKTIHGKHIFTHIEWNICCNYISCSKRSPAFQWVDRETLETKITLPTAFKKFWHPKFLL